MLASFIRKYIKYSNKSSSLAINIYAIFLDKLLSQDKAKNETDKVFTPRSCLE